MVRVLPWDPLSGYEVAEGPVSGINGSSETAEVWEGQSGSAAL